MDLFSRAESQRLSHRSEKDNDSIVADEKEIRIIHACSQAMPWTIELLNILDPIETRRHWLTEVYRARYPTIAAENIATGVIPPSPVSKIVRLAFNSYTETMTDASLSTSIPSPNEATIGTLKNQPPTSVATQKTAPQSLPVRDSAVIQPKKPYPVGYVEGGGLYGHLTSGYGDWVNQYIKGFVQVDKINGVGLQIAHDYEYREHGDYVVGDLLHIINEDWYTSFGLGISNKTFFVPKYYVGGAVFRKFTNTRRWIAYLGAHAYWWRPIYQTQDINPGLIYYFEKAWVVEAGALLNRSSPGNVYSATGYVAVTQGKAKEHYLTLRYAFGKEAYLPLGINVPGAVGYVSNVVTASWRQWWGQSFGTQVIGEAYTNKFYNRYGISIGIFKDF